MRVQYGVAGFCEAEWSRAHSSRPVAFIPGLLRRWVDEPQQGQLAGQELRGHNGRNPKVQARMHGMLASWLVVGCVRLLRSIG